MTEPFGRLRRFFRELKRRNVYKVAVAYVTVAFVVWQVADFLFPALLFPAWTVDFLVIVSLLGFPLALIVAWAFEMTPKGMRRMPEAELTEKRTNEASRGLGTGYKILVRLGLMAAVLAAAPTATARITPTVVD